MADKITNFEDYVKKEGRLEHLEHHPKESEPEDIPVTQKTMEIEIEDPFQFLNAEERDEYLRQRQKEIARESEQRPHPEKMPVSDKRPAPETKAAPGHMQEHKAAPRHMQEQKNEPGLDQAPTLSHHHQSAKMTMTLDEDFDDYDDEEFEEEYGEYTKRKTRKDPSLKNADTGKTEAVKKSLKKKDNKNDNSADEEGPINMDLVVRVASILTGIVILIFIAGLVKVRIIDRYMAPDPDEVQVAVSAIPDGYTKTGDVVVVTAESLNLRTVPSTESDETVVEKVPKGTQIDRLAISDDGQWALLERNGQQVFGYMKYMQVSQ